MPRPDCVGRDDEQPCCFRADGTGAAAQAPVGRERCAFCDKGYMASLCADHDHAMVLKKLKNLPEDLQEKGLEYIPDDQKAWFRAQVAKATRCVGLDGEACVFGLSLRGDRARTLGQSSTCDFCDRAKLAEKCASSSERDKLKAKIRKMCPAARQKAIEERIPPEQRAHFEDVIPADAPPPPPVPVAPRPRARRAAQAAGLPAEPPVGADAALAGLKRARTTWVEPLARRQSAGAAPTQQEAENYRRARARAQQAVRTKLGMAGDAYGNAGPKGDDDGTGLPPATVSLRAHHFERWCLTGSWAMCKVCFSLQPRDCLPATFDKVPDPYINAGQCWRCNSARKHVAPQPSVCPAPLRNLTQKAAEALSPLEINAGADIRSRSSAGYRVHARMMTFSWHVETVESYIGSSLQGAEQQQAWAAYEYLRNNNPAYGEFLDEHDAFLQEHPNPTDKQRMRWLRFIEREGVECALWPHLFWQKDLCFTYERATAPATFGANAARGGASRRRRSGSTSTRTRRTPRTRATTATTASCTASGGTSRRRRWGR